ncbi:MAG: hypothetical protein DCF29_16940 [Alphaproteobacteria bacterium]|nr:MAG: hypothetical protein DCF29_16940 [Alphaproteobacteria bacterium]
MSRPLSRRLPRPDADKIASDEARLAPLREQLFERIDRVSAAFEARRLRDDFTKGLPLQLSGISTPESLRAQFAPDDPCLAALPSLAVS